MKQVVVVAVAVEVNRDGARLPDRRHLEIRPAVETSLPPAPVELHLSAGGADEDVPNP
jgi:hypothetical protein